MDTAVSVELFVEILNRYVYYFDQQNENVSSNLSVVFTAYLLSSYSGYDQVSERSDRAYPLESPNQPGDIVTGWPKAAFRTDVGVHQEQGVRGYYN